MSASPDYPRSAYDLRGRVLDDRYRLIEALGAGGMATVYGAEHVVLGTKVAVKILDEKLSTKGKQRRRFLREARAASAIRNDHVVQIMDFGTTTDGIVYFVMEYLRGGDLENVLRAGPLPWSRARGILLQILEAIAAAHRKNIIHRDIKPANCFVFDDPDKGRDSVKVLDFGIAKVDLGEVEEQVLTGGDELFGTVAYMAPELWTGAPADARSDLYSFGVLAYRALVGHVPFQGDNAYLILNKHLNDPPPPPRAVAPSIPARVEAVIMRALAKRPDERHQTVAQLARELESVPLDAVGDLSLEPVEPEADAPRRRTARMWTALAPRSASSPGGAFATAAHDSLPSGAVDPSTPSESLHVSTADGQHPTVSLTISGTRTDATVGSGNVDPATYLRAESDETVELAKTRPIPRRIVSPANPRAWWKLAVMGISAVPVVIGLVVFGMGSPREVVHPAGREDDARPEPSRQPEVERSDGPDTTVESPSQFVDDVDDEPVIDEGEPVIVEVHPDPEVEVEPPKAVARMTDKRVEKKLVRAARRGCKGRGAYFVDFMIHSDGTTSLVKVSGGSQQTAACVTRLVEGQDFLAGEPRPYEFVLTL